MAPRFLKKLAVALKMREDSLAVLEEGLGEAGLSDADLASLDPRQLEKLRLVVLKTEVGDAIAAFQDRIGTEFKTDERRVLVKVAEEAIKRSGRLAGLVATLRMEGENKQAAEIAALKSQIAGQSGTMADIQGTLQQMAAFMIAQEQAQQAQTTAANTTPATPPATAVPTTPPPTGA